MPTPAPPAPCPFFLFEAIVRQTPEAIVFADRDGVIRVWNGGAEALFGFGAAEAVGRSLDIIIPERFRQAHWDGFHRAVAQGRTRHGGEIRATRAVHRDGRKLYVDMSFGLLTGSDGSVMGSVAMARDATARRSLEAALRARVDGLIHGASAGGNGSAP